MSDDEKRQIAYPVIVSLVSMGVHRAVLFGRSASYRDTEEVLFTDPIIDCGSIAEDDYPLYSQVPKIDDWVNEQDFLRLDDPLIDQKEWPNELSHAGHRHEHSMGHFLYLSSPGPHVPRGRLPLDEIQSLSPRYVWALDLLLAEVISIGVVLIGGRCYIVFMDTNAATVSSVYFISPGTKGRSLEEADEIFVQSKSLFDSPRVIQVRGACKVSRLVKADRKA